jgi:hypothetical protein
MLKEFKVNYYQNTFSTLQASIFSYNNPIIEQLPSIIKGISGQIVSNSVQDSIPDSGASGGAAPETVEESSKTESTIADLDKFLGDDMKNIKVPEIDSTNGEKKANIEVHSEFIDNVLKYDLGELEALLTNLSMSKNPLVEVCNEFRKRYSYEKFTMLPKITENEMKSLVYLSKLFHNLVLKENVLMSKPVPATIPVLKYNPVESPKENVEIAYDLFTISVYVRLLRNRLEDRISDIYDNKSVFFMNVRFFLDPFIFSFLPTNSENFLANIVKTRYEAFDSKGMFEKYKKILNDNGVPEINVGDVSDLAHTIANKVVGKTDVVTRQHDKFFENKIVKLQTENTLQLEQIINEFIPLEIEEKMGKDLNDGEVMEKLKEEYKVSDEILAFFLGKKKKVKNGDSKKSPLIEVIERDKSEIPEQYRDDFLKHLEKYTETKFVFDDEFPYNEFGDSVIVALYVWDPENDSRMKKNKKYYFSKIEDEAMTKDLILVKDSDDEKSSDDEWVFD